MVRRSPRLVLTFVGVLTSTVAPGQAAAGSNRRRERFARRGGSGTVAAAMGHVAVSNLAYAHPGGDTLFFDVSFRLAAGKHAGLIGTNGVGKSTLMRIAAGELEALEGDVALGGRALYMPQDVGVGDG